MSELPEIMQLKMAGLVNENAMLKRKIRVYQSIIDVLRKEDKYYTPSFFRADLEYEMHFLDDLEREDEFLKGMAADNEKR